MRLDKWLWAARFFKTRALASRACDLGRITLNEHAAKPARELRAGDHLRIANDSGLFEIEVLALSEIRGPAAAAQTLYGETEASRAARMQAAAERKLQFGGEPSPTRRPTKRERRLIHRFRGTH